jgi:ActR/RegA family two-component response regulator
MRHPPLLNGHPILIVEDDPLQAIDLAESLEHAGAVIVGPAHTLQDALRLARTEIYSAAVLDFGLGDQNAALLAEEFHLRRCPFIVYTGYQHVPPIHLQWPGCRLLHKPASVFRLVKTLAALLRWQERTSPVDDARARAF